MPSSLNHTDMSCVEKKFELETRQRQEYRGTRYYDGAPVSILVHSSELLATDFHLAEVSPLQLDAVSHGGRRKRGASVRNLQGVGNSTFVLSVENDNDFRSRCE